MTKGERPVMIESSSGQHFKLADDVWNYCVEIAAEKNLTPREVLSRFISAGKTHTELEKRGAQVVIHFEGGQKLWKLFNGVNSHPLDK